MNGDQMLKTYIPFSTARTNIFKDIVKNGANIFYANVTADRIVSNMPSHYRYFRIKDDKLEVKTVINDQITNDWHNFDLFTFPVDGKFNIEKRFERFSNG
jgi:gamma-glutamyltranspeptidase